MAKASRIYDIRLKHGTYAIIMADAKPSDWMGVRCLRGRMVLRDSTAFGQGSLVSVPVEEIISVFEYDSFAAYMSEYERHHAALLAHAAAARASTGAPDRRSRG